MAGAESGVLEIFAASVSLSSFSEEARGALSKVKPELASEFVRLTYRDLKNNPSAAQYLEELCVRGARSEFSVSEWLLQVVNVYAWLSERERSARFSDVLEYISCAFEGGVGEPGEIVSSYLTEYGFSRSWCLR